MASPSPKMMAKENSPQRPSADFSTLSVYTYKGALAIHYVPASELNEVLPQMLKVVFGPREQQSVISITASAKGTFLVMDSELHAANFGALRAPGAQRWNCLYIHEASKDRKGAEISGALSHLCNRLATARISVLNVCTLARNFMIVREEAATRALATLRAAIEDGGPSPGKTPGQRESPPPGKGQQIEYQRNDDDMNGSCGNMHASSQQAFYDAMGLPQTAEAAPRINIKLTGTAVSVAALSVAALKQCSHAILELFFIQRVSTNFQHLFEMAGEVSLFFEEAALDRLRKEEPASASALDYVIATDVSRGWRVLDVSLSPGVPAPAGSEAFGILSAVCLPLADLPLLNVSTIHHTFVLVHEEYLQVALSRLRSVPTFNVIEVPGKRRASREHIARASPGMSPG